MTVQTDLHIHSCLSPCADSEMTPSALVETAVKNGLQLIALTDHNTCRNCPAVAAACRDAGIGFIPGIEITTREEIHYIALFPDLGSLAAFTRWLDTLVPGRPSRPVSPDRAKNDERRFLFMARNISVDDLNSLVKEYGGIGWPAHVDKPSNSLFAVLGCWPQGFSSDAVELYDGTEPVGLPEGLKRIQTSDAHRLADIGCGFPLPLSSPDYDGLANYLKEL